MPGAAPRDGWLGGRRGGAGWGKASVGRFGGGKGKGEKYVAARLIVNRHQKVSSTFPCNVVLAVRKAGRGRHGTPQCNYDK